MKLCFKAFIMIYKEEEVKCGREQSVENVKRVELLVHLQMDGCIKACCSPHCSNGNQFSLLPLIAKY
jgi:hypothetical protein